jgi:BetI-type transcriptional repressor, C-terminal
VMESQPHLLGFEIALSSEAIEPASDLHEFFTARYTVLRRWLMRTFREGIDAGEIRPDVDPGHEASCFVALLDGLRLQWFFAEGGVPIADRVRIYVEQLVARIELNASDRSGPGASSMATRPPTAPPATQERTR